MANNNKLVRISHETDKLLPLVDAECLRYNPGFKSVRRTKAFLIERAVMFYLDKIDSKGKTI